MVQNVRIELTFLFKPTNIFMVSSSMTRVFWIFLHFSEKEYGRIMDLDSVDPPPRTIINTSAMTSPSVNNVSEDVP